MWRAWVCVGVLAWSGCGGPQNTCAAVEQEDGSVAIQCGDDPPAVLRPGGNDPGRDGMDGADGMDGSSCTVTDNGDGTRTLSCEDGTMTIVKDGADGMNGMNGMNGADGMNGMNGMDGMNPLIKVSEEPPGMNCPGGGTRIDAGIDENANGELDVGEFVPGNTAFLCDFKPGDVVGLDVGDEHGCVTFGSGQVKCWGRNGAGQLGDGNLIDASTAVNSIIPGQRAMSVSLGGQHTCAVLDGGAVQCWGSNGSGQLGDGTTQSSPRPVAVQGLSTAVTSLANGRVHTCAVVDSGGLQCWGGNAFGQLGVGDQQQRTAPVVLSLPSGVDQVVAGDEHTCVLLDTGAVYCWGENSNGQLGDATTQARSSPTPVQGLTSGVTAIAAGARHTCAARAGGAVTCWGANARGQLGTGGTLEATSPAMSSITGVTALTAGSTHTCGLTASRGVLCWGDGVSGQLGNGANAQQTTAVAVSGLNGVREVRAGGFHTCALLEAGGVRCWGANDRGQLGTGTMIDANVPSNVALF